MGSSAFWIKGGHFTFPKGNDKDFTPILDKALVYIDDILLFSPDKEKHLQLLQKFQYLFKHFGIMLS